MSTGIVFILKCKAAGPHEPIPLWAYTRDVHDSMYVHYVQ